MVKIYLKQFLEIIAEPPFLATARQELALFSRNSRRQSPPACNRMRYHRAVSYLCIQFLQRYHVRYFAIYLT